MLDTLKLLLYIFVMKLTKILLLVVFLYAAVMVITTVHKTPTATHNYPPLPTVATAAAPVVTYNQDPAIVAVMQNLGLNYSKLNLINGTSPQYPHAIASFIAPNSMYISSGVDPSILNRVVSHEYVHYIEFTVAPSEASSFYPYISNLVTSNNWLYNRTVNYRSGVACGGTCNVPQEGEAIACTEMSDTYLTPDFISFCNKYLPQRYHLL